MLTLVTFLSCIISYNSIENLLNWEKFGIFVKTKVMKNLAYIMHIVTVCDKK